MSGPEQLTDEDTSFAHWSMETTRRLSRTVLPCGPGFSVFDLVRTRDIGHKPIQHTEYETDIHDDMLSVVLAHVFHQALLVESPEVAPDLADLSYEEALRVVYHHQHDA